MSQQQHSHRRPTRARSLGAGVVDATRPGMTRLGIGYALMGGALIALLGR